MGAVYKIRCEITKLGYVGRDKQDDEAKVRLAAHVSSDQFHNPALYGSIVLHGIENHRFWLIESGVSPLEITPAETWWIHIYNYANPRFGFNIQGTSFSEEVHKDLQADMLKREPRRRRRYKQLENDPGKPLVATSENIKHFKNAASSAANDARFIAECEAKGLRRATKDDIGAKVVYCWKFYSNYTYTGTLVKFGPWATIINDDPAIAAKWPRGDEIQVSRGVIFVLKEK
jgi:hypothetical protein